MSARRSATVFGYATTVWTAIIDASNWTTYSSLQKWILVSFVAVAISWQFSLWTLVPLFIIISAAGVKLSEEILHNSKTSHIAELVFYKLESAYIDIRSILRYLHVVYTGGKHFKEDITIQAQIINELSAVYEIDLDKATDNNAPFRLSADITLELNSIQLLIIRDFIQSWYADISYDPQFRKEIRHYLQESFNSLALHLSYQDPQVLLTKIIKLYHYHFSMYQKAKNTYESHKIHPKTKVPDNARFKRHSSLCDAFESIITLHPALESEAAEMRYLTGVVSMIVLSSCSNHLVDGLCVKTLLVQILTSKVMLPVMKLMSNPDWLMEIIINLTSDEKLIGEEMASSETEPEMFDAEENIKPDLCNDESLPTIINNSDEQSATQKVCSLRGNDVGGFSKLASHRKHSNQETEVGEIAEEILGDGHVNHSNKHHIDHDCSQSFSLFGITDPKQTHSEKQQSSTSSCVAQDSSITHPTTAIIPNGNCDLMFDSNHFDNKDFDNKDFDSKHLDNKKVDSKLLDSKEFESKHLDNNEFESKHLDNKEFDRKHLDNKEFGSKHFSDQEFHSQQTVNGEVDHFKKSSSKEQVLESFAPLSAVREECVAEGECDSDIFHDPFEFVSDPQKIMSFQQHRSSTSVDSDTYSSTEHSLDRASISSESDTGLVLSSEVDSNSETATSSFPKFSSIKSFFVDSLKTSGKQQLKKPKSLSLFSEKLASNLNPLTQSKRLKSKNKETDQQEPPQLLVDGVPLDCQEVKQDDSQVSSVSANIDDQPTPTYSDIETTPSPGFFSSVNSFFHLSSSQSDMNKLCESDGQKTLSTPASSPLGQSVFGIGSIAVIKDLSDVKPFELDDRRIFQDVTIPETSICTEFRSTTQYSLYNLQFEALYFTEEGKSVIRSGKVWRRYREFLNLQSRLESHPSYKKYLKNIKVPKRWPTMPFKSIDKETVESRRLFLEKYMKSLIEVEAICNGPDLREFLAYEGDSHIAFVKKSPDIVVPRLDKMFMRGVSEVVDRIKALPNIPQEMMIGLRGRETPDDKQSRGRNHFDADTIEVNIAYHLDMISENSNILPMSSLQVLLDLDTEDDKDLIHNVITDPRNIEQTYEAYKQEVEKVLAALPRVQGDGSELPDVKAADQTISLSLSVLDLLVQGLQDSDHWICRERVVRCMHSVLGKALNRYLETSISSLTTNQQLGSYLKILRETIWPRGQLWSKSSTQKTEDERQATKELAKKCLIHFFPVSLRLVIGEKEFEAMIASFLSSVDSEKMNRHILYLILDMLVEQIFPEVTSHDLLHSLLFSKSRNVNVP